MKYFETIVSAKILNSDSIIVSYKSLPGNNPCDNDNWIGVWQGSMITQNSEPFISYKIELENSNGQLILDDLELQRKPYIVGYGVGKSINSICSTVQFTPQKTPVNTEGNTFATSIQLLNYNANDLLLGYTTPPGNIPVENKNWIGLWPGDAPTFSRNNLLKRSKVTKRNNVSSQVLSNIILAYNSVYTVAYGMGDDYSDLAAMITFSTGESVKQ